MNYRNACIILMSLAAIAPVAVAQRGGGRGGGGRGASGAAGGGTASARPVDITAKGSFDMASVDRGGKIYAAQCASCHGADARGGKLAKTDSDLMRSELVVMDHSGRELPGFLAVSRPDKNMPAFQFSHDEGVDLATWLHYQVTVTVARQDYQRHNVFSGDPKAGEAYFNGSVGKCNTCHSVTGDLKGIGAKRNHDAPTLQTAILSGGRRATNITATVTLADGETFTGTPWRINDFVVEIRLANGENKTWLRNGEWPKVSQVNRLQAHVDLVLKYTDDDIHNLAAYLNDK